MKHVRLSKYVVGKKLTQASRSVVASRENIALSRVNSIYQAIVGSALQASQGVATHSSIQQAVDDVPAGGVIRWLAGTYTENLSIDKSLKIEGSGYGVELAGNLTYPAAGDFSELKSVRINGNITFQAGSQGNRLECWQIVSGTFTDLGVDNASDITTV